MMIWHLQMQCTLDMFHFGEQLFSIVFSAKHAHYLLGVGDKAGESSRCNHMVLKGIGNVASKKLEIQISFGHWKSKCSICNCNGPCLQSTSRGKEKILKVWCRSTLMFLKDYMCWEPWLKWADNFLMCIFLLWNVLVILFSDM